MNATVKFDFVANKNAESGERTVTTIALGELTNEQVEAIASALVGLNNLTSNRRKGFPRSFKVTVTDDGIEVYGDTVCTRTTSNAGRKTKAANPFLE